MSPRKIYTVYAQYLLPVRRNVKVPADNEEAAIASTAAEEKRCFDFWENTYPDYDDCFRNITFTVCAEEDIEDAQPEDYDIVAEGIKA